VAGVINQKKVLGERLNCTNFTIREGLHKLVVGVKERNRSNWRIVGGKVCFKHRAKF